MSKKQSKKMAPGVLPSDEWLINNGKLGLYGAKKWYPEDFAHIKQNPYPPKKKNK